MAKKPLTGVRILVVEDDPDIAEALHFLLAANGAMVRCATSAVAARAAVADGHPHLLISDLAMPGEDGYAFLASVRALPLADGGGIPALAFSAMSPVNAKARALAAGFQVFLRKPEDVTFIIPALVALLPAAAAL